MLMESELFERIREIPEAVVSEGAFGPGDAVWVGRREVAHFDAAGNLDLRMTRAVIRARRDALREDPRIVLRPGQSDWMEVNIATPEDVEFAAGLIREAVIANGATAPAGPPPTGGELERRRRFH